jgi:DNA-binding GntR family transcriptional regulator
VIELARRQALGVAVPAEYERVYDGVSQKIAEGVEGYHPKDRLPTIRSLATEYDVSQTTVKIALTLLGRDGWTRGVQGKGTFVADAPPITQSGDDLKR